MAKNPRDPRAILISIRPAWVERILAGEKMVEFRRVGPAAQVSHLVIYASSPTRRVVAVARVSDIVTGSPTRVWARTRDAAGMSRREFRDYFRGSDRATAFRLEQVRPLHRHLPLARINPGMTPPQSWCFLNEQNLTALGIL